MITLTKEEGRFLLTLLEGIQEVVYDKDYETLITISEDIDEALTILQFPAEEDMEWESDIDTIIKEIEEEESEQCI